MNGSLLLESDSKGILSNTKTLKSFSTAAKKASRVAAEGMVYADYCPECKVGVVIEVNAETDFVAKNDKFVAFVKEATKVIMKQNPADVEALMSSRVYGCRIG